MKPSGAAKIAPDLRAVWQQCRPSIRAMAVFSAGINLLWLAPSLYMLQVYDRVLGSGSVPTLVMLSLITVFLMVAMGVLEWVRSQQLVKLGERIHSLLAERLFDVSLRQSLATGGQQSGGQPLQDMQGLRQFLTGPGLMSFFDAPWLPFYTLLMFAFHPLYGWLCVFGAVLLTSIAVLQEKRTAPLLAEANREAVANQSALSRTLAHADVIEGLGMGGTLRERWQRGYANVLGSQSTASRRAGLFSTSSRVLRLVLQSATLGVGAWLVLQHEMSPGLMIAGSIMLGRALAPIDQLTGQWRAFVAARGQFQRINDWLTRMPVPQPRMLLPPPTGEVAAESIAAAPPGSQLPVLRGISFRVASGEVVGVVGPSAAGKSTLARVLLGIWPTMQGRLRLDGADVMSWERAELGRHIGYLPQDVELFDGTIAENIARHGEVESEKIIAAAQQAGVHDLILRMPRGYDSPVAATGGALTAGQRQRLGLARALYGEPRLVVLDEPNSNLDEAGDAALVKAIASLKARGSTVFVISHRSSIMPVIDKLLVLQDGALRAFGPRDEVLAQLQEVRPAKPAGMSPLQIVSQRGAVGDEK